MTRTINHSVDASGHVDQQLPETAAESSLSSSSTATTGVHRRGVQPEFIVRQQLLLKRVQVGYEFGFWSFLASLSAEEIAQWQQFFPRDPISGATCTV